MAELKKGIPVSGGAVGEFTVYERLGKTVVRQKHRRKGYGERTVESLGQKTKYLNVVNSWRCFDGALKGMFELKRPGQSDYNAFTACNLIDARVYLTKVSADRHYAVLDHFVVSKGTLEPVVQVEEREDILLSDIVLTDLEELTLDTAVGDVAYAIVQGNRGYYRYGDEVVFLRATPYMVEQDGQGILQAGFRVRSVALPIAKGRTTLRRLLNVESEEQRHLDGFLMREGRVACEQREESMVAWVHRRRLEDGRWAVTTQRLAGPNNEMLYMCTQERERLVAIMSYHPEDANYFRHGENNLPIVDPANWDWNED